MEPESSERQKRGLKLRRAKEKAGFGRPFGVIFKTILIFLAVQIGVYALTFLGYSIWEHAKGLDLTHQQIADNLNWLLENSTPFQFISIVGSEGGLVLLVWLFLRQRGLSLKNIGFSRRPKFSDLKYTLAGAGVYYVFFIAVANLLIHFFPGLNTNQQQDIGFSSALSGIGLAVAFISLVIMPPLGEETLMRGYLYTGLRAKWSFVSSAIVTSILFGAAHLPTGVGPGLLWIAGLQTFILSLVLVYMREKSGALYAGMLLHALNNVIAFFVHFHS
jgi:membrane protease YdiL (CAAX protease family)